jgi:hypothetical protein
MTLCLRHVTEALTRSALQIHQDGAIPQTASERPIVYPEDARRFKRRHRSGTHQTEKRRPTGWHGERACESRSGPTTQGEADLPERRLEWHAPPSEATDQT